MGRKFVWSKRTHKTGTNPDMWKDANFLRLDKTQGKSYHQQCRVQEKFIALHLTDMSKEHLVSLLLVQG